MIDQPELQSLIRTMERAAEEVLQRDPAFFEALHALKLEIEANQHVRSAMHGLQRLGQRAVTSFVPRINIRIRTATGLFGLTHAREGTNAHPQFHALTEELRMAAGEVIRHSRRRRELNAIVNEAILSSDLFEGTASKVEQEGYEIIISLDFSAFTRVLGSNMITPRSDRSQLAESDRCSDRSLSTYDLMFLNALGIRADL